MNLVHLFWIIPVAAVLLTVGSAVLMALTMYLAGKDAQKNRE